MKRRILMTPGPSPVPSFIRAALSEEIMHHRTSEFRGILKSVNEGLKEVFCTKNTVITLASSGTGAMEAAVTNLFSKGDKVIAICGGKFGERWAEISRSYALDVVEMNVEWGESPSIEELEKVLCDNKDAKGVLTTLCETSTAAVFDIESIGRVTKKKGVLLAVDAISGLGQDVFYPDKWGVDVVVNGSQKGLMLPPGLGFISVGVAAKEAMKNSNLPKYYFDLNKALEALEKDDTPFTPAVSLITGLEKAISAIRAEGIEVRWQRFAKIAEATRRAAEALGLKVFAKSPSNAVTAIYTPSAIKSRDIVKKLRSEYGLSIAAGQGDIEDKIFRIAHMGWINEQDLIVCFSLLEKALLDLGYKFKLGASLSRIQEVIYG